MCPVATFRILCIFRKQVRRTWSLLKIRNTNLASKELHSCFGTHEVFIRCFGKHRVLSQLFRNPQSVKSMCVQETISEDMESRATCFGEYGVFQSLSWKTLSFTACSLENIECYKNILFRRTPSIQCTVTKHFTISRISRSIMKFSRTMTSFQCGWDDENMKCFKRLLGTRKVRWRVCFRS